MAFYADEDDIWKCPQHPSKRRRSGICAVCLAERLAALCPDCANLRPCPCSAAATSTSTSSSASSSFSIHFSDLGGGGGGSVGRISTLIDSEPAFQRSRSAAVFSIFRSARFSGDDRSDLPPSGKGSKSSMSIFSSMFRRQKSRRGDMGGDIAELRMRRSRSVAASISAEKEMRSSPAPGKGKGWYFPSPMKVFRHSKAATVVHERSPLHRG